MTSVVIGGDVCSRGKVSPFFSRGESELIFHDLLAEFQNSSLSIVNLESPFIEKSSPINKAGSHLGQKSPCVNGFVNAGINVVVLANNHILDHGEAGLKNTLEVCSEAGLSTVGAGENIEAASKLLIREINGMRVGIYATAEHEFSIATKESYGANPLDLIDFVRVVKSRKNDYDFLIVIIHGGNEHYPYPSPGLMKRCRFLVEMGANAVICQHTHCPGCIETYLDSPIVYGQGNLVFETIGPNPPTWYEGFLVKINIAGDFKSSMEIVPYHQSKSFVGAKRMNKDEEVLFLQAIFDRSCEIEDENLVEEKWNQFCEKRKYGYLGSVLGYNRLLHRLNRKGAIINLLHSEKSLLRAFGLIKCEAHREILETVFSKYLKER